MENSSKTFDLEEIEYVLYDQEGNRRCLLPDQKSPNTYLNEVIINFTGKGAKQGLDAKRLNCLGHPEDLKNERLSEGKYCKDCHLFSDTRNRIRTVDMKLE